MPNTKTLYCRTCGEPVQVDERAELVICGRCVMGSANRQARLARERAKSNVVCDRHPRYRAVSRPRNGCTTCQQAWDNRTVVPA